MSAKIRRRFGRIRLLKPEIIVKVYDKNGNLIKEVKQEAKCFVKNFAETLYGMLSREAVYIHTPDNVVHNLNIVYPESLYGDGSKDWYYLESRHLEAKAGADNDSFGVLVGTGTTAPTNEDYKLESQVPQGTGDNQLDHNPVTVSTVTEDTVNNITYFDISRIFYNLGAVDIGINEIALYVRARVYVRNANSIPMDFDYKYLVIRDVLATTVTVPAGGTLTVTYRLKAGLPFASNFMKWLRALMASEDTEAIAQDGTVITIKGNVPMQTSEGYRRYVGPVLPMDAIADEGNDNYGVLIGSSSTAEAITDYALGSKLTNDVMRHYAGKGGGIESLTDKWSLKVVRDFVNVSGVDQTVAELGLATLQRYYMAHEGGAYKILDINNKALVFRKVISAITVTSNQVLRVTIIISIPK